MYDFFFTFRNIIFLLFFSIPKTPLWSWRFGKAGYGTGLGRILSPSYFGRRSRPIFSYSLPPRIGHLPSTSSVVVVITRKMEWEIGLGPWANNGHSLEFSGQPPISVRWLPELLMSRKYCFCKFKKLHRLNVRAKEEQLQCTAGDTSSVVLFDQRLADSWGVDKADPPAFLTKMFEMAEDPVTVSIVSWSRARERGSVSEFFHAVDARFLATWSIVNFSSFISELNEY